jgi:hypothetical protein
MSDEDQRFGDRQPLNISHILSDGELSMKKILSLAALLLASLSAQANISVQGDGKLILVPNKATITLGVVSDGQTAAQALSANADAMKTLFQRLKDLGIADRDVQTIALHLTPKYRHVKDQEPVLIGYTASHQIAVTVRKVDDTGAVLDALVKDGANQVQGISFGVEENEKLMDEARMKAVVDARRKAELYASAGGVTVGKVVSISEVYSGWPTPKFFSLDEFRSAAPGTPIAKGEMTLSVSVSVVFAIGEAK